MQNSGRGVRKFFSIFPWGTKIFSLIFMGYRNFFGIWKFHSALVPGIKNDWSLMVNNKIKILRHPFNVCYDCDTVINKSLCFKPALLRKPIDFTTVINFYHPLIFAHHSKRPSFSRTPSARSNCCAGQVRENKRGVNLMEMRLNSCTTMSSS